MSIDIYLSSCGTVLTVPPQVGENDLYAALIERGVEIRSSRCGNARTALHFLNLHRGLAEKMAQILFSFEMSLRDLSRAFEVAKESDRCLKILIDTTQA